MVNDSFFVKKKKSYWQLLYDSDPFSALNVLLHVKFINLVSESLSIYGELQGEKGKHDSRHLSLQSEA
jgi:hypothetical protein